jgi:uncharacterized membrane protein
MGKYTVYIRQDLADCRMGNFLCDVVPGAALACNPAPGPEPNGTVVVRSEGVASDGRTRVALEVTMTPSIGAQQASNTPLSALCSAGASGCDDNTPVMSGIVVNSPASQSPPPGTGGSGTGGAGTGGAGTGGAPGTGGAGTTPGGTGGATTPPGAGGSGTGGSGMGGSPGTGGSTSCLGWSCPRLATMGLHGIEPAVNFKQWLSDHSSTCFAQDLLTETNPITPARLSSYDVIIVLDIDHLQADYDLFHKEFPIDIWQATVHFNKPAVQNRQFSSDEAKYVKEWVQNGGGLFMTQGYNDSLWIISNANKIVQQLGLTFYSPDCGLDKVNCFENPAWQDIYGALTVSGFAAHPITVGVSTLYVSGTWPISGYPPAPAAYPPSWLPAPTATSLAPYQSLATITYKNHKNATVTHPVLAAGPYGNGRVVAWGDEWITSDASLTDKKYGPSARNLWNNALKWLGKCP